MDRNIPIEEKQRRRRVLIAKISIGICIALAFFILLPRLFEETINLDNFPVGVVDSGPIEVSISASGKLSPLVEEIIVSPINSRILEVYKSPGDTVREGEPLLKLDITTLESEYLQRLDEREMKISKQAQVRVNLENSIMDLEMQRDLRQMQLEQVYSDLQVELYLDSLGATTIDKLRRARLGYEEMKLSMYQLDKRIENDKRNAEIELRALVLEFNIFEKSLKEKERLLKNAQVLSTKNAILTSIADQVGSQVSQGSQLAIVSDFSKFKVECEIPDGHREKIAPGALALVHVGNVKLTGYVSFVTPNITNGMLKFTVILEDSSHSSLRRGLSADVDVIYGMRDEVLRIPAGKHFTYGKGDYNLWVIAGDKIEKRNVRLGESSFEYIEVEEGLSLGESVVLREMRDYTNKTHIKIR